MGYTQRQPMHSDFERWLELRDKVAHANSDYEMVWLMTEANRIEERWTRGRHAARWLRLQAGSIHYPKSA